MKIYNLQLKIPKFYNFKNKQIKTFLTVFTQNSKQCYIKILYWHKSSAAGLISAPSLGFSLGRPLPTPQKACF